MVSGHVQDSRPHEWLPDPFVVRVSDPAEHGVPGVRATWRVVRGWGELSATSSETDGAGRAATFFRGWGEEGVYAVEARVSGPSGSPVTFRVGGVAARGPKK